MADLPSGVNTFSYSGSATEYTLPSSGVITVELWGAAGGGGHLINQPGYGGAGALVQFEMNVTAGDVLKIEVGGGGKKAPIPPGNGGLGGWPDGGAGGAYAPLASSFGCSGGGGSTRVYINNVLMAVAAAGGGGLYSAANNGRSGGHGGSTVGGIDERGFLAAATTTQGGYHAAATYLTTPNKVRGASLSGGNGWAHSDVDGQVDNAATPTEFTGCGGGGGYYGGAGGVAGERQFPSGGGGTSYANTGTVSSSTVTAAFWFTPPDTANRPDGVAEGGTSGNGTQTDGGDGYVWLEYEASGQIGEAEGDLATATLTAPAAAGEGGFTASFDIGTATLSAPAATAEGGTTVDALLGPIEVAITGISGVGSVQAGGEGTLGTITITSVVEAIADSQVYAIGLIGTVEVQCNLVAGPVSEANVTLDLSFELEAPESYWTDEGDSATGEADIPGEDKPDLVIGAIGVGAVQGFYYSEDQEVEISEIGTVTTVPAEAYAAQAVASPDLPGPVVAASLLGATATGAVNASGIISFIPEGGGGGTLLVPPEAQPSTADMATEVDFGPHVTVEPILGVGLTGDDVVLAVGQAIPAVNSEWTNTNDFQGTGQALARPLLNGNSDDPGERYISRAVVSPILGAGSGGAVKTVPIDLTVTFGVPQGLTQRGQSILAPIGTVYVRRALGGAGEDPNIEGDALTDPLPPVIVTAPVMDYNVAGNATGDLATIYVLPPPVEANVGQDFPLNIPGPIIVTSPEGAGWEVDPSSTGNGDLTALVVLTPPEGTVAVLVAAVLPSPVRIYPVQTVFHVVPVAGTAVFAPVITGDAILRRVENGVAVVEDRIEATVVIRG